MACWSTLIASGALHGLTNAAAATAAAARSRETEPFMPSQSKGLPWFSVNKVRKETQQALLSRGSAMPGACSIPTPATVAMKPSPADR
jgi:hypothetical protein